jgi:polar amino acid transport system substrate-binding protein
MKWYISIFLLCSFVLIDMAHTETLQVLYLERPPYYFTVNGRAEGFLVKLSRKLFQAANIQASFSEMPPKRIIKMIKTKDSRCCSIGWFKNPEREGFAKFSLPIYQDKSMVILTLKNKKELFQSYRNLKDVFSDNTIIFGAMSEFSYGSYIDDLLKNHTLSKIEITSRQSIIPEMILKGRATFMIIAPEEIDTLLQSSDLNPDDFISIPMPDIPEGNKRYLMFSQDVRDETIGRINIAIQKHMHQQIPE